MFTAVGVFNFYPEGIILFYADFALIIYSKKQSAFRSYLHDAKGYVVRRILVKKYKIRYANKQHHNVV